jgi:hypothetical protein
MGAPSKPPTLQISLNLCTNLQNPEPSGASSLVPCSLVPSLPCSLVPCPLIPDHWFHAGTGSGSGGGAGSGFGSGRGGCVSGPGVGFGRGGETGGTLGGVTAGGRGFSIARGTRRIPAKMPLQSGVTPGHPVHSPFSILRVQQVPGRTQKISAKRGPHIAVMRPRRIQWNSTQRVRRYPFSEGLE